MTAKKVLIIGFDPTLLDFSSPELAHANLTAEKVLAGLKADGERLKALGYEPTPCLVDLGETAESVIRRHLGETSFECICIGAGIRVNPKFFLLFERIVNVTRELAPQAKLCFNTKPSDTAEAIQRWV